MLTAPIITKNDRNGQKTIPDAPKTKYTVDQLAMAVAALAVEVRQLRKELAELQEEIAELGLSFEA